MSIRKYWKWSIHSLRPGGNIYCGQLRQAALALTRKVDWSWSCFPGGTELVKQQTLWHTALAIQCTCKVTWFFITGPIPVLIYFVAPDVTERKEIGRGLCAWRPWSCHLGEGTELQLWKFPLSCCLTREVSGLYRYWILIQILSLGNLIYFVLYIPACAQVFLCLNTSANISCIKSVRSWGVSSDDFQSSVLGTWFEHCVEQQGQSWKHRLPASAFAFHMKQAPNDIEWKTRSSQT